MCMIIFRKSSNRTGSARRVLSTKQSLPSTPPLPFNLLQAKAVEVCKTIAKDAHQLVCTKPVTKLLVPLLYPITKVSSE